MFLQTSLLHWVFLSYASSICLFPGLLILSLVILDLILSPLHSNVSKNSYAKSKSQVLLLKKKIK